MREIPVHYDPAMGWIADVPRALLPSQLQRLVAFVLQVNQQRVTGVDGPSIGGIADSRRSTAGSGNTGDRAVPGDLWNRQSDQCGE
jgi:hypothetical protein